ncbi:MAG: hypothetical protein COW65_11360 [Cytophagales bacterium CG18_big_fil_WC_8_21_14_2_50_42_9]|nr:MAG: hypothetical protein COW65_11360 [Cytophagales bacterium CG18_big_fil_WC_8_21_14_2_50_42_9]
MPLNCCFKVELSRAGLGAVFWALTELTEIKQVTNKREIAFISNKIRYQVKLKLLIFFDARNNLLP